MSYLPQALGAMIEGRKGGQVCTLRISEGRVQKRTNILKMDGQGRKPKTNFGDKFASKEEEAEDKGQASGAGGEGTTPHAPGTPDK